MSNLEAKFDALESQIAAQHTALTAALTATNTKLDTLISLFGGTPPTPTATLDDVVTAITATNTTLGYMHLDTISMDQKLLRIRDAINPLDEALPTEAKSSIPWLLFRIMDAINPTWPRPTSTPAQPALSLLLALAQLQLPNLADIHAALGTPTGDATTTALGLLASIQYSNSGIYASTGATTGSPNTILELLAAGANGCPCASPNALPTGCASPYVSTGMVVMPFGVIPGGTSTVAALFDSPLPTGITYSTTIIGDSSHASLHNDDWAGWSVYVSSDLAQFSWDTLSSDRHATNTWLQLPSGEHDFTFSVRDTGGLTVTLCSDDVVVACVPLTVHGNGANEITNWLEITEATTVHWLGGQSPVGMFLEISPGSLTWNYIGAVSSGTPISANITAAFPINLGFSVGQTTATADVEVCRTASLS